MGELGLRSVEWRHHRWKKREARTACSHFRGPRCHIPKVTSDEDDDLHVRRTLAGDPEAFAPLVRKYRRAALARALAIVLDRHEADDVAQGAFVQAYEQLATLRDPSRFENWLMTIVRRRALNALRSARRRRLEPLNYSISDASWALPDEGSAQPERARELLAALAQLTPVQRTVVLLADLEEWPHRRIADALRCSIEMSRRHLSDARRRLRQILTSGEHTS
jgi:RNA polymerase sigma factor (sigma-70 family)